MMIHPIWILVFVLTLATLPGFGSIASAQEAHPPGNLETIVLPVRVHRLQSDVAPDLNCSLSDGEIREQFVAVNETWAQANIEWEIESIVNATAQAPDDFIEAMSAPQPRGLLAPALAKNVARDNLLKPGFNVVIAEDSKKRMGGVFIPQRDGLVFYARRGPKGVQTPAVLAHELGHALGLPHTIFEKGNNLMMGGGPERVPTRTKPITV
ncbi:MAG: zinc metalloprotease, partial [Planctomycetota bacterium]